MTHGRKAIRNVPAPIYTAMYTGRKRETKKKGLKEAEEVKRAAIARETIRHDRLHEIIQLMIPSLRDSLRSTMPQKLRQTPWPRSSSPHQLLQSGEPETRGNQYPQHVTR